MCEIDLLHQPDDEHEAECDQREQQAERQAVQEMRKKVEQGFWLSQLACLTQDADGPGARRTRSRAARSAM
jgi:hypothetical protein